ncbi:MAG: SDR family NAD(P)-dependent oxidoreductase [Polyangiales bacterium]
MKRASLPREAIVIGAGLGGMATAIGLSRAGWKVTLCERASALTPAGFGIGITTNGLQALAQLGAHEPVLRVGCAAADSLIKTPDGKLITTVPARTVGDRFGLPTRIFHRADLQEALRVQLPEGCLRLGARCVGIEHGASRVTARFDDGQRVEADLLVGADGVSSTVRRLLHGDDPLRFAHYVIWLSLMELSHPVLTPGYNAHYWGTGSRFGIHDVGDGRWYWWGTQNQAEVPARLRNLHMARCDENAADMGALARRFADFPSEVRHAIAATPEQRVFLVNTRDRAPLASWSRGRVTLLGDAAHPMLTSLGQGAVMGFEDAAVLVACLAHARDVPTALRAYDDLRIPKTSAVVRATRHMSDLEQAGDPRVVRARNAAFRRLPRALVDREVARLSTFTMPDVESAVAKAARDEPRTDTAAQRERADDLVIVTGASSGIGRAIARDLARRGFTVLAGVRGDDAHAALTALGEPRLQPVRLEVTDPASIQAVMRDVGARVARGARLYGLVNNAAVCVTAPVELVPLEDLRTQLEVNVIAVVAMIQAALPLLLESRGRIVNIGSNVGRLAPPFLAPYGASKAALEALGTALRREVAPFGVHVSLVVPGPVNTPVWGKIERCVSGVMARASDGARARYARGLAKLTEMNQQSAARSRLRPEHVSEAVAACLLDARPRHHHDVGFGAAAGTVLGRGVPARWIDRAFGQLLASAQGAR